MVLDSVVFYSIKNNEFHVLAQKRFVVRHMDNQDRVTENVMQKISAESLINGHSVPKQGIVNMFLKGLPMALIYQNKETFGVVFVLSNSDDSNRIAASLTLDAVTSHMLSFIKSSSVEKVMGQPECFYSTLDTYLPNGQGIIANTQVYRSTFG